MKKLHLIKLGFLLLTMSTLSACLLVPLDEGGRRGGGHHESDRGEHRGDRHEGGERR